MLSREGFWKVIVTGVLSAFVCSTQAAQPLEISVIGGNGMIGQRIVREALDRGHEVTVIVREPSVVEVKDQRLRVRKGDVLDKKQLAELLSGQDVIVSAVGSARDKSPDPTLYRKAAESLVGVLQDLGKNAPRLIVVGGVGSLKTPKGDLVLDRVPPERKPEHLGQQAALDYYRTISAVSWTYVSPPGSIKPGERTGVFRIGEDTILLNEAGDSAITMEDYAVAIINEAESPAHVGRRFTVGY
ncbi:MAG: NAD(P)H-binding protein [Steroidobacter sp.]